MLPRIRLSHVVYAVTIIAFGGALWQLRGLALGCAIAVFWVILLSCSSKDRDVYATLWLCFSLLCMVLIASSRKEIVSHRARCQNKLREITSALRAYHETYGSFPPAYVDDTNGRPMHSWRVLILPFLDQPELYEAYDFSEPWDGPNNRQLHNVLLPIYACSSGDNAKRPTTSYLAVVDPNTAWPETNGFSLDNAADSENTILLVEANSDILWLEPRDLSFAEAVRAMSGKHGAGRKSGHSSPSPGRFISYLNRRIEFVHDGQSEKNVSAMLTVTDDDEIQELKTPATLPLTNLEWTSLIRFLLVIAFIILALLPWTWRKVPKSEVSRPEEVVARG